MPTQLVDRHLEPEGGSEWDFRACCPKGPLGPQGNCRAVEKKGALAPQILLPPLSRDLLNLCDG
jgi:hypothetical protein